MENKMIQINKSEILKLRQNDKNNPRFLEDYGFSILIPTFDYECFFTHFIYEVAKKIAKLRKKQKALDKKHLNIFAKMYEANKNLIGVYEIMAKATGALYAELYYKTTLPTLAILGQLTDYRVGDILASYDLGSTDKVIQVNEAKRLLMDIVKERVLFDLIVTGGKSQSYDISSNNQIDIRLNDALATYGLAQVLSNILGDGTYINISLDEGLSLTEPQLGITRKVEYDIKEYYKIYEMIHGKSEDKEKNYHISRIRQIPNS